MNNIFLKLGIKKLILICFFAINTISTSVLADLQIDEENLISQQTLTPANAPIRLTYTLESKLDYLGTKSCSQLIGENSMEMPLVQNNHFKIENVKIDWQSTEKGLDISLFKIQFKDKMLENDEYMCVITGEELKACAGFNTSDISMGSINHFNLPLKCGELKLKSPVSQITQLKGQLRMVGYQTCDDGCANRVTVDSPIILNISPTY